jgi:hypothetical protein
MIIHLDLQGLEPVTIIAGFRWFVIFIEECTRVTWVYVLKYKNDILFIFKQFLHPIQTQVSIRIKTF